MCGQWGLLGPGAVAPPRRTRDLGLRASVRKFNDLAVPGLGNVWFCKEILLALLGVAVAENARARGARVRNIEVANSVEALACWLAFTARDWATDKRLRGRIKLREREAIRFEEARKPGFYVTLPMRMSTVQALPALGLVEAGNSRFNSYRCTKEGRELLDAATRETEGGLDPYGIVWDHKKWAESNFAVRDLTRWVMDGGDTPGRGTLRTLLSPVEPLPEAALALLRHRLLTGSRDAPRRRDAFAWVATLRKGREVSWTHRPPEIRDPEHWRDLEAGASFFALRDAALRVLDAVEGRLGPLADRSLAPEEAAPLVADELAALESAAKHYLGLKHRDPEARKFAQECQGEPTATLRALVERDGQVVRLRRGRIVPGPAFRGSPERSGDGEGAGDAEEDIPQSSPSRSAPPFVSDRIHNLLLLRKDLEGRLDAYLKEEDAE